MLQLANSNTALTMSSLDIANLTGKNHSDVKRDIMNTLSQADLDPSKFAHTYNDAQNRSQPCYLLPKRECDLVVSGYSVKYRLAIIDRWQELESNQFKLPQSFAEALRLAADQQETIQAQAAQIEQQKPAVEFIERYVQSTGNLGFRQACKLLKANETEFRAFLTDQKIMYKLGGDWVPYGCHIVLGRFHTSTGTSDNDHNYTAAKFTPKGIEWITRLWSKHEYNNRELLEQ
jgi:phage antirepressor YoqD-like protein